MTTNPSRFSRRSGPEVERSCSEFRQRCKAQGLRMTEQRLAVYRVLASDLTHPTAEAVFGRLRARMPSLSQATVYRILESLERERLIRKLGTISGPARYDADLSVHQHLVCRTCGGISDFNDPLLATVAPPDGPIPGFRAEEVDIRLLGTCEPCSRGVPYPARHARGGDPSGTSPARHAGGRHDGGERFSD